MIGKELEMITSSYPIISDRICLLSNNLPQTHIKEDENNLHATLFLNNLSLKRK